MKSVLGTVTTSGLCTRMPSCSAKRKTASGPFATDRCAPKNRSMSAMPLTHIQSVASGTLALYQSHWCLNAP